MSPEDFDDLIAQAQEEARNPSLKAYFPLYAQPQNTFFFSRKVTDKDRYICIGRKT